MRCFGRTRQVGIKPDLIAQLQFGKGARRRYSRCRPCGRASSTA